MALFEKCRILWEDTLSGHRPCRWRYSRSAVYCGRTRYTGIGRDDGTSNTNTSDLIDMCVLYVCILYRCCTSNNSSVNRLVY